MTLRSATSGTYGQSQRAHIRGAHFAAFPMALISPCILAGSREGDVILDPFFGSGTVAEAARFFNRNWIGIELNPKYKDLYKERLGLFDYTNK